MQAISRRHTLPGPTRIGTAGDAGAWGGGGLRRVRAARRIAALLAFTFAAIPVQAVCLLLPGRPKIVFARFYWSTMCRLIGLRVRVLGEPARRAGGRSVVFASNHSSYLDILVLGGRLEGCFVAKEEVAGWPVIRTVARLGRTVFVSRRARNTGRERDTMRGRLEAGDNLVLFPEGTSNDGSRVLPFRSAFFSIVEGGAEAGVPPLIQPVSVVYDQLGGLPTGRATRAVFAWYGDMELGSHCWQLLQHRGLRATMLLHPVVDPAHSSRKAVSQAVWTTVAEGAATLRQNRPPGPAGFA